MRYLSLALFSALALSLGGCSKPAPAPQATTDTAAAPGAVDQLATVTVDDLSQKLDKKTAVVVCDANNKERFDQGHIPTARWVDSSNVTPKDLPADKASPLVFYCGNEKCMASHHAAKTALSLGYTNVSILPAGIQGWEKAGKPTTKSNGT